MVKFANLRRQNKAIVYLNTYNLNFSRENPWNRAQGDFLWLPENGAFKASDGVIPDGLRIRSAEEMFNIETQAMHQVLKGGYKLLEKVIVPIDNPKFENALDQLDSGKAQMLVTYSSMLPKDFVENGLPTEFFLTRARTNHWRISLISLFANPIFSSISLKSEYMHFGKGEELEAVLVKVTDPLLETMVAKSNKEH